MDEDVEGILTVSEFMELKDIIGSMQVSQFTDQEGYRLTIDMIFEEFLINKPEHIN